MFTDDWVAPAPGYEELDDAVDAWAEHACPHPRLRLVDGQVFTRQLQVALADHGGDGAYPALADSLPRYNGGSVLPDQAHACLEELDRLSEAMREQLMVVVVDLSDGAVINVYKDEGFQPIALSQQCLPSLSMYWFDGQYRVHWQAAQPVVWTTATWLDPDGVLRVRDVDDGRILFAASEIAQRAAGDRWTLRDVDTGAEIYHDSPITRYDDTLETLPRHLRAETRPIDIDVYLVGVAHLRALFTASVLTGNPVHWY